MESNPANQQESANQIYEYAANLLVNHKQSAEEVTQTLINQGINEESSKLVVSNLQDQIIAAKKERAKKDMLYGALWCVGGLIATVADIGFIFWGAILFGGIQFFKGLANA